MDNRPDRRSCGVQAAPGGTLRCQGEDLPSHQESLGSQSWPLCPLPGRRAEGTPSRILRAQLSATSNQTSCPLPQSVYRRNLEGPTPPPPPQIRTALCPQPWPPPRTQPPSHPVDPFRKSSCLLACAFRTFQTSINYDDGDRLLGT